MLRGLDPRDFSAEDQMVEFHHRPQTDAPLRNKSDDERVVGFPPEVAEAVQDYLEGDRWDTRDENGREPLLLSRQGRMGMNSVHRMSYQATQACNYGECPQGQEVLKCDYRETNHESKCLSSRSPLQIRTRSISRQLDCGIPIKLISERANVGIKTLKNHCDKTEPHKRMERRRRPHLEKLPCEPEPGVCPLAQNPCFSIRPRIFINP